jgi:cytochrome c553
MQRLRSVPLLARLSLASLAVIVAGGFLFAWSGVYSVAASRGHFAVVEFVLAFIMRNSVETHAYSISPPPQLSNPDLEILGAGHFHRGCAPCHGAPGQRLNATAKSMLPPPPDLSNTADQWKDRELFWIVKHGIKYTGMPAWATQHRDDEVWALVAFLKTLPTLDVRGYARLAFGADTEPPLQEQTLIMGCAFCHGDATRVPRSGLVPTLHGQPAAFLQSALSAYANGRRHSGIMQPIATDLSDGAIAALARHYAGLVPPRRSAPSAPDPSIEHGQKVANEGKPTEGIPPCLSCHGAEALDTFPRLAGQSAEYMTKRLRNLRAGIDGNSETAAIMIPIARLMSDREIEDVSAYFSAQALERRKP